MIPVSLKSLDELLGKSRRPPKYKNTRPVVDGIQFDSKAEAARWFTLRQMECAGLIRDLKRQVSWELAPSVRFTGARATPALRYIADAVYQQGGHMVVEDCKGFRTEAYRIKRHLMLAIHGIEIKEVKA